MIQFHSGKPPKGFKPDFESFLFNTAAHRKLQSKTGWVEYHLMDNGSKSVLASVYFNLKDHKALSPVKAPFGSLQVSDKISSEEIRNFILKLEDELSKQKIQSVQLVSPPELYSASQHLVDSILAKQGFDILKIEPGCCIEVNDQQLVKKMFADKRARLKMSIKAGLTFKKIPKSKLKAVYNFIASCRKERGQDLSMTYSDLKKTIHALPKSFFLVGAYSKNKLAAATVCIRVNKSIVYTFYSAHPKQYDKLSPLVFLLNDLYEWCQNEKVTLLDLGTSYLENKPNTTLLDFKLRMGGELTPKFYFHKTLRS